MGVSIQRSGNGQLTVRTSSFAGLPTGQWTGSKDQLMNQVMGLQSRFVTDSSVNVDDKITQLEADLILAVPDRAADAIFTTLLNSAFNAQRNPLSSFRRNLADSNRREMTRTELGDYIDWQIQH